MAQHILIEHAYKYPVSSDNRRPDGFTFNQAKGYWILDSTGQAFMESKIVNLPNSKKWDRETGEDHKGE